MLQEALRRLGNISDGLPWAESVDHLNEYSNMLRISGYSEKERYNYIKIAVIRHRAMKDEVKTSLRDSMFRMREQILKAKDIKGGICAATCFLGGNVESTVSCQATPGSTLVNLLKQKIGTTAKGNKRLVVEEGGLPVSIGLKLANPFKTDGCQFGDNNCLIQDDHDCGTMGAVYCIKCLGCKAELDPEIKEDPNKIGGMKSGHYLGMTNVSVHNRTRTHRLGHERGDKKNTLYKHDNEKHNGIKQQYKVVIVQKERSLLHLVMREAIMIDGNMLSQA